MKTIERFNKKYIINPNNNCWEWQAGKFSDGYGNFYVNGQNIGAHRWSYQYHVGSIENDRVVDHICRNKSCVNPDHLRLATV